MKFEPNLELDLKRQQLKNEYDEVFNYRRTLERGSEQHAAAMKTQRHMEERTKAFITKHALYFSRKRFHLFDEMERKGVFGEKPKWDNSKSGIKCDRRCLPQVIKNQRVCVECGQLYIWYQERPTAMCRVCRSIGNE